MKNGNVTWLEQSPKSPRPHWLVQCAPHVMTRLKRVFERVDKTQHGAALLVDTPENSRELLWFLDRYPMATTSADLETLKARAEIHKSREAITARILQGEYTPTADVSMALPGRPYQILAAELANANGQLLLADDLGLGKTVSAIITLVLAGKFPALVVTMTHLPRQWQRELARFCPDLKTHILEKGTPYNLATDRKGRRNKADIQPVGMPDVIITNYHKLSGWADTLGELPVRAIVFDEIQELRRGESNGVKTAKYSAAEYISHRSELRLGLSHTPIYNYGGEIYHVLSALAPDSLGTQDEFKREFCTCADGKWRLDDPAGFGQYMRDSGLMLRRTRTDVGREVPELSVFAHQVETDRKKFSGSDLTDLARIILSQEQLEKGAKFRAAAQLDYRLRRETGMAKAEYVSTFVRGLAESGEPVVLFGWHLDVYAVWRQALKDFSPAFYTGEQSSAEKEREIDRFKTGKTPIAILSLRSGAGLDGLQHVCRTVVFGELDWSPGIHEQCVGRVHRDGQQDPVCAYFMLADTGSDPIIADALGVKRGQIMGLRDPDAPLVEAGADPHHMRRLAESFLAQRGELEPQAVFHA